MTASLGFRFRSNHIEMFLGQDGDCFCEYILHFFHLVVNMSCENFVSLPVLTLWGWYLLHELHELWTPQTGQVIGVALFSFASLGFFSKGIMGELLKVQQRCLPGDRLSVRLFSYTGFEMEDFWSIPRGPYARHPVKVGLSLGR